jgi:hypothetical protein
MARLDVSDGAIFAAISDVKDFNSSTDFALFGYVPKCVDSHTLKKKKNKLNFSFFFFFFFFFFALNSPNS